MTCRGWTLKAVVCSDLAVAHISAVCCGRPKPMQCCLWWSCPACCHAAEMWTICWSQVVDTPTTACIWNTNNILLSHLFNYAMEVDASLATYVIRHMMSK